MRLGLGLVLGGEKGEVMNVASKRKKEDNMKTQ